MQVATLLLKNQACYFDMIRYQQKLNRVKLQKSSIFLRKQIVQKQFNLMCVYQFNISIKTSNFYSIDISIISVMTIINYLLYHSNFGLFISHCIEYKKIFILKIFVMFLQNYYCPF